MLSHGIILFHDNASPHAPNEPQNLITEFGWEQFEHLPTALTWHQMICICFFIWRSSLVAKILMKMMMMPKRYRHGFHRRWHHSVMKWYKDGNYMEKYLWYGILNLKKMKYFENNVAFFKKKICYCGVSCNEVWRHLISALWSLVGSVVRNVDDGKI